MINLKDTLWTTGVRYFGPSPTRELSLRWCRLWAAEHFTIRPRWWQLGWRRC